MEECEPRPDLGSEGDASSEVPGQMETAMMRGDHVGPSQDM
jgi:hypothetical protein